jgi:hypothetical protein
LEKRRKVATKSPRSALKRKTKLRKVEFQDQEFFKKRKR